MRTSRTGGAGRSSLTSGAFIRILNPIVQRSPLAFYSFDSLILTDLIESTVPTRRRPQVPAIVGRYISSRGAEGQVVSVLEMNSIVDMLVSLYPQDTWARLSGVLASWRERLDTRDNYSGHHAGLATQYAVELARRQGEPMDTIAALWVAGHVYDLGKISVPENVLVKQGPLSTAETLMMRNHVSAGYDLLRDWDVLKVSPRWLSQVVLEVVLFHHERWDGAGYPRGLKEHEIPLPARIMTVADAFAAMVMDSPYRAARVDDVALAELEANAGAQFDPYLVQSFSTLIRLQQMTGKGPARRAGESAA